MTTASLGQHTLITILPRQNCTLLSAAGIFCDMTSIPIIIIPGSFGVSNSGWLLEHLQVKDIIFLDASLVLYIRGSETPFFPLRPQNFTRGRSSNSQAGVKGRFRWASRRQLPDLRTVF